MTSQTSATLLERLRDGSDPLAWGEFSDRYWRFIFALAKYHRSSDETAEDIVQEVMLAVFEKQHVFRYDRSRGRFRDWLRAVVRNQVIKRRQRASERVRARGGDPDRGPDEPQAPDVQPEAAWETAFERTALLALLDLVRREVSPPTFQAFELLEFHGRRGAEVAKITGLSRNAVYLARKRVRRRLRQLGASYRDDGQLTEQLKQALASRPSPRVQRSVTERIENTRLSRQEPNQ